MNILGIILVIIGLVEWIWTPRFDYLKSSKSVVLWYNGFWFRVTFRKFFKLF